MAVRPLCIYHGSCADGFTSAWVVNRFFNGEVDFYPGVYQKPPPDVTNRHVIMVDFSYKKPIIEEMSKKAHSILILDHHKSAMEDLGDYPKSFANWFAHVDDVVGNMVNDCSPQTPRVLFDMERSGAGITWDFFYPEHPRLKLIDHVEDRDLWKFEIPHTRVMHSAIMSYPMNFENWDALVDQCERNPDYLVTEGNALDRKHFKDIDEFMKVAKHSMVIGGVSVPAMNCPYMWASDAANIMAEGEPFAACYWDGPTERNFSLRSKNDGMDVSAIAIKYGGGGHKNAAGFAMPRGWEGDIKNWDSLKKRIDNV